MHRLASLRAPLNTAVLGIAGVAGLLWLIAEAAGDTADRYWDPLGLLIVLGGTLAATLIAFRGRHVWSMLSSLGALFEREPTIADEIETIVRVAALVGRSNVRLAEAEIAKVERPFLRLGLQLALDGVPVEEIMHVLNWRIQKQVERETAQARLYRTLANFAPALGMLGTLVGLVNMLTVLGAGDLDRIGRGLSVALITTVRLPDALFLRQPPESWSARLSRDLEGFAGRAGTAGGVVAGGLTVERGETMVTVRLNDRLLFPSGRVEVAAEGLALLHALAPLLAAAPARIEVQGHTDSVPIGSWLFPSNWELSGARAAAVVRALVDGGVPAVRMSAAGYADTVPRADDATPEGRQENRRVELVLRTRFDPPGAQPIPAPEAQPIPAPRPARSDRMAP